MRRYHITDRDDYKKLNQVCGMVTKLVTTLKKLDSKDETRIDLTDKLLDKYVGCVKQFCLFVVSSQLGHFLQAI